jgi:hypothetical protein
MCFDGRFTISNCREKIPFAWDEFVVSRFEFGESRKIKKYFGHLVLPFWSYHPKKIHRNTIMEPSTVYGIGRKAER